MHTKVLQDRLELFTLFIRRLDRRTGYLNYTCVGQEVLLGPLPLLVLAPEFLQLV